MNPIKMFEKFASDLNTHLSELNFAVRQVAAALRTHVEDAQTIAYVQFRLIDSKAVMRTITKRVVVGYGAKYDLCITNDSQWPAEKIYVMLSGAESIHMNSLLLGTTYIDYVSVTRCYTLEGKDAANFATGAWSLRIQLQNYLMNG